MHSTITLLLLLMGTPFSQAQSMNQKPHTAEFASYQPPILVEVMGGNNNTGYQMVVNKKFSPTSKFRFFNLISYEMDYDEQTPASYIVQTIASYEVTQAFYLGLGTNLKAFGGLKPLVSISYSYMHKNVVIFIQPSQEIDSEGDFEVFAFIEVHPVNQKKIQFYGRLQVLTTWNRAHSYSYQAWRIGLQFQDFRFGPAFTANYLGETPTTQTDLGAFINFLIKR